MGEAIFGELGKIACDGSRIQCHVCGKWFHHLGCHVHKKHGLLAEAYREKFGLNRTTPLASPVFQSKQREGQSPRLSKYWEIGKSIISNQGPEERSRKVSPRLQGNMNRASMNRRATKIEALRNAAESGTLALLSEEAKRKSALSHQTPEARERSRNQVLSGVSPLLRPDVRERTLEKAQSPAARAKRKESLNRPEYKAKISGENSHNKRPEIRESRALDAQKRKRNNGRFAPGKIE